MRALDKESAHKKELENKKAQDHDHRNLYLAKVFSSCLSFFVGLAIRLFGLRPASVLFDRKVRFLPEHLLLKAYQNQT